MISVRTTNRYKVICVLNINTDKVPAAFHIVGTSISKNFVTGPGKLLTKIKRIKPMCRQVC